MSKTIRCKEKLNEFLRDIEWNIDFYDDASFPSWRKKYEHRTNKYRRVRDSKNYALRDRTFNHWKGVFKFFNRRRHRKLEKAVLYNVMVNIGNDEFNELFTPYDRVENPWSYD